jgi:LysR family glycine cleavage system transcriptional activator
MRAFEAAGRHLSITQAAGELNVTQSAVSRQVKALEQYLRVQLFERGHHSLRLTEAGQLYLDDLSRAFELLDQANERISEQKAPDVLKLRAYTTFAMRWLIPRMSSFRRRHPEIMVQLTTSTDPVDFSREDIDIAIRAGEGTWPGMRTDFLVEGKLIPVCAPELAARLSDEPDLLTVPLIHSMAYPDDWRAWFAAIGRSELLHERNLFFESSSLAYQAAIQGLGVAIAQPILVEDDLGRGALCAPFAHIVPAGRDYYIARRETARDPRKVRAFRNWLLEEVGQTVAMTDR